MAPVERRYCCRLPWWQQLIARRRYCRHRQNSCRASHLPAPLRSRSTAPVYACGARSTWDGRTLQVEAPSRAPLPGAWCLDGRQVAYDGQTVCCLGDGGWPDLAGPACMSTLDMLAFAPAHGEIAVRGRQASHGDLWLALGAPLGNQLSAHPAAVLRMPVPRSEVLAQFDLACLATPHDVLNDDLLPLLRCTEVWERAALPAA